MGNFFTYPVFSKAKLFLLTVILCSSGIKSYATAWTTSTAGAVNNLANWTDGTSSPTTFTTPGDTWTINLSMTMPTPGSWVVGTSSMSPVTVTFAAGGTVNTSGAGSTSNITVYGDVVVSGGTFSLGGAGTTQNVNTYGNFSVSSGTVSSIASSTVLNLYTYGNFSVTGGTVATTGAGSKIFLYTHGNLSQTGGTFNANGASGVITNNIYGNCTLSGTAAMTNTGAGCTNNVHLALHRSLGTMMIDNTSTGAWSGTNIYVDTNCIAQLDGNFSTTTGTATYGLTVNGVLICPAAYTVNGTRMFTLNGVATLEVAHATGINGAIVTTGTKTFATSANYVFNGTAAQVTGTFLPASLVAPDTILVSNSAGVTLTQTTLTTGTLGFTNGILNTGAFTMSVPGAATSVYGAGATTYVNGTLIKTITGLTSVNYEVGDLNYAPMLLTLSSAGTAGSLGLKATNGLHPSVGTSGILTTNIANHYWTVTNIAAAGPATIVPKATYNLVDIIGGSNTSFKTQEYTGTWLGSAITSTNTSSPYTSAPNTGIALATVAGDYIYGNSFCGTAPITGGSVVCVGATLPLSDATPGGSWASGTPGVATVSVGGVVTGVSAGVVTITYTVGACAVTTVVTVNPLPNAGSITGAASVCVSHTATLTDAVAGGTWSSSNTAIATVGISGVVTGVAAGSVTITYTVTNSCGTATATHPMTVISLTACALLSNNVNAVTNSELKVFPNPNTGVFIFNLLSPNDEQVQVVITNMVGQVVKTFTTTSNDATEIALDPVPGIYFLSAFTDNARYYVKVLVK